MAQRDAGESEAISRGHQRNMSPTNVVLPECAPQSGGKRPEPWGIAEKGPAESLTLFGAALLAQRVLAITRDCFADLLSNLHSPPLPQMHIRHSLAHFKVAATVGAKLGP